jgi:hypothetical protein
MARDLEDDEAAIERTWNVSGNLHILADRLGLGLQRGEVSPALAWVHKALLMLADGSVDKKPYAQEARDLVRYVAVREAHEQGVREGKKVSWEEARMRAAETLRGHPAEAQPEYLWKVYKRWRKALRVVRPDLHKDDPGYSFWPPDKS